LSMWNTPMVFHIDTPQDTQTRESWKKFVKRLEHDATGAQRYSFKVFKNLKSDR
jgi:hypothetical protein